MSNSHTPVPQPTSKNGGTLQDNAGTVVCVGDVVAFNYSGEIAVGTVTAIKTMPPVSNSGVFYGWERYRNVITIPAREARCRHFPSQFSQESTSHCGGTTA